MAVLHYGHNSSVELEFAGGVAPDESGTPRGQALADPAAALTAMLAAPIDYPALAQCTTPGDKVVLALDRGVPQVEQITAAIIRALIDAGIAPDGISVLRNPAERDAGDPCRLAALLARERIKLLDHDPTDRRQLAYLAASEAGDAILINRTLHDADLVLPVGCLHGEKAAGYFGIHDGIFPTFSDTKTIQRFRSFKSLAGRAGRRRELTAEVDNVAWILGINFTIQLIPAAGDRVLHVLAGESQAVRRQGKELYRAAWSWPVSHQASLVVAAIEGGPSQQTWENVGRSLQVARRFVEDDGSIALCCDLAAPPGPAMRYMASGIARDVALRQVGKERPADALPAAQLARALDRGKVYMLSRLDAATVEELDVIPIAGPDELARLVDQHESCILLANAPFVTAVEEHHD
jgi:nickel-dependent lactate racemase